MDERGQAISATELERKAIGKATFKVEATTISTAQRIQIRKVFQKLGLTVKQGDEASMVKTFVQKLLELAESAGGEAPKPAIPDTTEIQDILNLSGNDQLLAIYHKREMLYSKFLKPRMELKKNCKTFKQKCINYFKRN